MNKERFEADTDLYLGRIQNFLRTEQFNFALEQTRSLTRLIKNYKKIKKAKKK